MLQAWKIEKEDNVAIVLQDYRAGDQVEIDGEAVTLNQDIPMGHKFALRDMKAGDPFIKYALTIGLAKEDIRKGDYVHTHNLKDITTELCQKFYEEYMARGAK